MFGLRSTLVSLLLATSAITSIAATPFAGSEQGLSKRESRKDAAIRVRNAKARAARKARRDAAHDAESELEKRQSRTRGRPGPIGAFATLTRTKCSTLANTGPGGSNAACQRAAAGLGANGIVTCYNRLCTITCNSGYVLNTQTGECVGNASGCPAAPSTGHGAYTTDSNGNCVLTCDSSTGYTAANNGCYQLQLDPNNCGRVGNVCPSAYVAPNGSRRTCVRGQCYLSCGQGTRPFRTSDGTRFGCN